MATVYHDHPDLFILCSDTQQHRARFQPRSGGPSASGSDALQFHAISLPGTRAPPDLAVHERKPAIQHNRAPGDAVMPKVFHCQPVHCTTHSSVACSKSQTLCASCAEAVGSAQPLHRKHVAPGETQPRGQSHTTCGTRSGLYSIDPRSVVPCGNGTFQQLSSSPLHVSHSPRSTHPNIPSESPATRSRSTHHAPAHTPIAPHETTRTCDDQATEQHTPSQSSIIVRTSSVASPCKKPARTRTPFPTSPERPGKRLVS